LLLSRAPTEQEVEETHAMVAGSEWQSLFQLAMILGKTLPMPREHKITIGEMRWVMMCRPEVTVSGVTALVSSQLKAQTIAFRLCAGRGALE
jgi:hypothetical protein